MRILLPVFQADWAAVKRKSSPDTKPTGRMFGSTSAGGNSIRVEPMNCCQRLAGMLRHFPVSLQSQANPHAGESGIEKQDEDSQRRGVEGARESPSRRPDQLLDANYRGPIDQEIGEQIGQQRILSRRQQALRPRDMMLVV